MGDFEDTDFCVDSWSFFGKKASKKKDQKLKNSSPQKTQPGTSKAKKKSKFKEAMVEKKARKKEKRKDKNKEKKKKKKKKIVELDDLVFPQSSGAEAELLEKLTLINQNQHKHLNPDPLPENSTKEAKSKKHVAFASLPSYIRVKRPHFASSSPRGAEPEGESCSQVVSTGPARTRPQEDLQCASDDVNSQDLFITQKTFRASPSSSEASDRAASPPAFELRDERRREVKRSQDSRWLVREPEKKIKTEPEGVYELHQWEEMSFQTQMKFKVNLPKQEEEPVPVEPKAVDPREDEPFVINPTPDVASCRQYVCETPRPPARKESVSTQTENFFSAELSLCLGFSQKRSAAAEDLKPLDLSLPQRARNDRRDAHKTSTPGEVSRGETASASTHRFVETTPSPPSETDAKSADMTASSEDDHFCRSAKRDLLQTQVGAVQLRLNKPFFFKTKGDGPSPRPESPLMKLSQGRDTKRKKHR